MTVKELKKFGFKPTKVGKNYYIFTIYSVGRKKKLCYGVYPMNVKTGKSLDIIEYIDVIDIMKNRIEVINKAKRNLIRKLKKENDS